jgi:hypothetical protein
VLEVELRSKKYRTAQETATEYERSEVTLQRVNRLASTLKREL